MTSTTYYPSSSLSRHSSKYNFSSGSTSKFYLNSSPSSASSSSSSSSSTASSASSSYLRTRSSYDLNLNSYRPSSYSSPSSRSYTSSSFLSSKYSPVRQSGSQSVPKRHQPPSALNGAPLKKCHLIYCTRAPPPTTNLLPSFECPVQQSLQSELVTHLPIYPIEHNGVSWHSEITFSPHYGPTGSTYSSTPVTLTRFNQRRTSLDYNNDSDSTSKDRRIPVAVAVKAIMKYRLTETAAVAADNELHN
ncbi:uncharacterized protein LOC128982739 [Macrosteles quadrilineatus]|uniref:uncharacterized protein LOC128982739 n=1 Tax=Macrosteles quadrilineatus TaxID=74068 RepID=UPI0023E1B61F|nr:uncharacterized protein LOC128982739 [Macrosteles quadrilineatus]